MTLTLSKAGSRDLIMIKNLNDEGYFDKIYILK